MENEQKVRIAWETESGERGIGEPIDRAAADAWLDFLEAEYGQSMRHWIVSGKNYAEGCTFVNSGILGKFEAKTCTFESGKPADPNPEPDGRITILITNGAPVRIDPAVWQVVARGDAGDRLDSGRCRGAAIVLRKHEDGRTVCEAAFVIDGREDIVAGKVGVPSTEVTDGFLALQVKAVAEYLNSAVGGKDPTIRRATAKALASLPAVDL